MTKKFIFFILFCCFAQLFDTAIAQSQQAPGILWQKTLGGNSADVLTAMYVDSTGTTTLCGYSNSDATGRKSDPSYGAYDYWVIKMNSSGNIIWDKTFGGSDNDYASAIIGTADGGYLVGGSSISEKSGSKSANTFAASYDYWVLKLDANGNKVWDRTLGGNYNDRLTSLAQLPNGTYVVGGFSFSNADGSKTSNDTGSWTDADFWSVILNSDGSEKSQAPFGGQGDDRLICLAPTSGNGFYAAGTSYSQKGPGKNTQVLGNCDYYVVRTNSKGQRDLEMEYGGSLSDFLTSMQVLPDSSFVLAGYSNSPRSSTKTGNFYGATDFWMVKLRKDGTKIWDRTIAGGAGAGFGNDYLMSVSRTKDKGFILGGYSNSNIGNNKTENSKGGYDYWIVKTDSTGMVKWDKTIGGSADDIVTGVYELDSGKYIVAGTSASPLSGDKTSTTIGSSATDYWVVCLGTSSARTAAPIAKSSAPVSNGKYKLDIMPNPVKDVLTIKYNAAGAKASFVLYAANGKTVLQATLTAAAEGTRSFNVANLPAGSYFAVMYVDGIKVTQAFTKE